MAYAKRRKLKDGSVRWYACFLATDGKYHEQGGYPTRREAEREAHKREVAGLHGEGVTPRASKMTFSRYVEELYWPATAHLEISTRAAYRYYLDKHFLPRFGSVSMIRIVPSMVQAWVNDASRTLAASSVVKYHALLHNVFARAVIDRVVAYNPCTHSQLPKVIKGKRRIVTPTEFDTLVDEVHARYLTLVLLDIETGLRWGELVALRPVDIDVAGRRILVHRTLVEVAKKNSPTGQRIIVKPYPKDDEQRSIQVEPETIQMIRQHMVAFGVRDDGLLFTSSAGTALSRNNFRTKYWQPALKASGLALEVKFHDLRAAHASWLLAGGADLQVVMERLGHRQITTTQKYLGTLPDSGDKALEALARIRTIR